MRIQSQGTAFDLSVVDGILSVNVDKRGYDGASLDVIERYVEARENETGLELRYQIGAGEIGFRQAFGRAASRLDKLSLAQKLVALVGYQGGFRVPLVHPDNVYLDGALLRVVHCGLQDTLAPMSFDEGLFLRSLQAMVLQIFQPKLAFEQILDGSKGLGDKFSRAVLQTATTDELFAFVGKQLQDERTAVEATRASVSKRKYSLYRGVGVVGLAVGVAAGIFAWQLQGENRLQSSVVDAQASFLKSDYSGTLAALEEYSPASLPVSAKYVLAVSSVNLDDLTAKQKQAILNNISEKSDDNTLSYWIAIGRGEFEQAVDRAKNIGDDQLILFAYTDLYEATKLDSKMPGSKKQELLEEYAKAIDELTAKLEGKTDGVK